MPEKNDPNAKSESAKETREDRLAKALRENLKKRKSQSRNRQQHAPSEDDTNDN